MTFQGELTSIGLSDLLQYIESGSRSGTLSIDDGSETHYLYLTDGQISRIALPGRRPLFEVVSRVLGWQPGQLDELKKGRRGTRRSLGETAVRLGMTSHDQLREIAIQRLLDDACRFVIEARGEFLFEEGKEPTRTFDSEEKRFDLLIPVSSVLLEAATRADEIEEARKVLPSDDIHLVSAGGSVDPASTQNPELSEALLTQLDGSASVGEVRELFPGDSTTVTCMMARWLGEHRLRVVGPDELAALARSRNRVDPERALELVRRGLQVQPRHRELLEQEGILCEQMGSFSDASRSLRLLGHQLLEEKDLVRGRELLEKARDLEPADPAPRERLLDLAIEEGRTDDAIDEGMALVELHRVPGLHDRARGVLERLITAAPDRLSLRVEWARSAAESGDPKVAAEELLRIGRKSARKGETQEAKDALTVAASIDPGNKGVRELLSDVQEEVFERRRLSWQRWRRRAIQTVVMVLVLTTFLLDLRARLEIAEATSSISQDRLIELGLYSQALDRYQDVVSSQLPLPAIWLEANPVIEELRRKIRVKELGSTSDR